MWDSFGDDIDFVLTHPNGYEGPQQRLMREAVVLAGLVHDAEDADARVRLVTEGEASLHYCIQSGLSTEAIKVNRFFLCRGVPGMTLPLSGRGGPHDYWRRRRNNWF